MSVYNSFEAFRRIRRQGREVRVIMMSAYSVEHLIEETLKEGVVAFLRKPLDAAQLLELLGSA